MILTARPTNGAVRGVFYRKSEARDYSLFGDFSARIGQAQALGRGAS
jgi:hypothetical protein